MKFAERRYFVMKSALLLLVITAVLVSSLESAVSKLAASHPPPPDLAKLLANLKQTTFYEGLPHPFEEESRKKEIQTKDFFILEKELLYSQPLDVSLADAQTITELFTNGKACVQFRGEKFCGGFHADYLIDWTFADERVVHALLCFSCGESLIVDGDTKIRTDLSTSGRSQLIELLAKYRKQRPPFKIKIKGQPEIKPPPPKIELKP